MWVLCFAWYSHPGVKQRLARYVSLHLSLVDPIDAGPEERSSHHDGPECVSSQWVGIKAGIKGGQSMSDGRFTNASCLYRQSTYFHRLSRPPWVESLMMVENPPCRSTDWTMTAKRPANMMPTWNTSVHTTALRPPCQVRGTYYVDSNKSKNRHEA